MDPQGLVSLALNFSSLHLQRFHTFLTQTLCVLPHKHISLVASPPLAVDNMATPAAKDNPPPKEVKKEYRLDSGVKLVVFKGSIPDWPKMQNERPDKLSPLAVVNAGQRTNTAGPCEKPCASIDNMFLALRNTGC